MHRGSDVDTPHIKIDIKGLARLLYHIYYFGANYYFISSSPILLYKTVAGRQAGRQTWMTWQLVNISLGRH